MNRKTPRVPPFRLTAKLSIYMQTTGGSPKNLEESDKVILPPRVLEKITERMHGRTMPHPVIFEVQAVSFNKKLHCGVIEFSSPEPKTAFMPTWLMMGLMPDEIAAKWDRTPIEVKFVLRSLPKVNYVKFKCLSSAFGKIPTPRQTLENALQKFTCLTEGQRVPINYDGRVYEVLVEELKPKPNKGKKNQKAAGSLIDTTVNVDFELPEECIAEAKANEPNSLELGQEKLGISNTDGYSYWKIKCEDTTTRAFQMVLTVVNGDPDVYIHTATQNPDRFKYLWRDVSKKQEKTIIINPSDANVSKNWYFLAIHGYKGECEYRLRCDEIAPTSGGGSAQPSGNKLGSTDEHANDPNYQQCPHCQKYVSAGAFMMHEMRCQRNNWRCPQCSAVMSRAKQKEHAHCEICAAVVHPDEMQKHLDIEHGEIVCECGQKILGSKMMEHKAKECPQRMGDCRWCGMKMRCVSLQEHEEPCGARTVPCDICGNYVPRKRMKNHKSAEHGINPLTGMPFTAGPGTGMNSFGKADEFGNRSLGTGDPLQSVLAASKQQARAEQDAALLAALEASKAGKPRSPPAVPPEEEKAATPPAGDSWGDDGGNDDWGDDEDGEDAWGGTGFSNPTTNTWADPPRPKAAAPVASDAPLWSQMNREEEERQARKKPRTGQRVAFADGGPTRSNQSYMEQVALKKALKASMKTDDAPKTHEFPCPYCSKDVPLSDDYTAHISVCAAKTGF